MGLELRLAWRNVWRNPRRTWLTIAATVFAGFLVVFFVAFESGLKEKLGEDDLKLVKTLRMLEPKLIPASGEK